MAAVRSPFLESVGHNQNFDFTDQCAQHVDASKADVACINLPFDN